jgi:Protein of unknown function (DUF2384)
MPTFERQSRHIQAETIEHLTQWLVVTLGHKLTAFAVGLEDPREVAGFVAGTEPSEETEKRLRNLYAVTWFLAATDGPGSAHQWLLEPNAELGGRMPAELLHDGEAPEAVWFAAAPIF